MNWLAAASRAAQWVPQNAQAQQTDHPVLNRWSRAQEVGGPGRAACPVGVAEQGAVAGALLADELVGGRAAGAAGRGRIVGQLAELAVRRVVLVLVVLEVLHKLGACACTK